MGATAFAERAGVELAATGEHARQRSVENASDLTPQEARSPGWPPTATPTPRSRTLYISASTVDYHLRKVYRKLDIASAATCATFAL